LKLVYYSDTKPQVGPVAAAIHLNQLPADQVPEIQQLIDSFTSHRVPGDGVPLWLGWDESGNDIFTLHLGKAWGLGLQTVGFLLFNDSNPLDWKFFNVRLTMNFSLKAGAFISSRLNLDKLERTLVARGIQKSYRDIVALVRKTKELSKADD
jgi:hypothetical protein